MNYVLILLINSAIIFSPKQITFSIAWFDTLEACQEALNQAKAMYSQIGKESACISADEVGFPEDFLN